MAAVPYVRFLVLALSTLCLTSIVANMNAYNFTKICNDTDIHGHSQARYSDTEESMLQASTAIGALAASIPYTLAFQRYSKKYVFLTAGVVSIAATVVIPFANDAGFGFFLAARIVQGTSFSTSFPMVGIVTSSWASVMEHGIFLSFLTAFSQIGNIFMMPVAGALCASSLGWHSVYFLLAAISGVLFALFAFFFFDTPAVHPLIGYKEKAWIARGREELPQKDDVRAIPYRSILTSKTIWGVWAAAFADILAIQFVSMFNPQYVNDYLGFSVMNTGFLSALPVIAQLVFKIGAGVSSDLLKCFNETMKLRIYNSLALALSGIFFVVLAFIPPTQPVWAMILLILAQSFMGFNTAGFNKCATLHSGHHSHFVMIQIMNIQAICILVEPFIANSIVTDNTEAQFRVVFFIHAAVLFVTNLIFCLWADSRPAEWSGLVESHSLPDTAPKPEVMYHASDDGPRKASVRY